MGKTQETNTQALGLYVHVPFCSTTCDFCAFYQERPSKKGFEDYFFALERDFKDHSTDKKFSTVFVGGGTPGLLSAEHISKLCQLINRAGVEKNCEWTVEVAPNEIDQEKITAFLEGGVNRLSLGIQTFNQEFMDELGRDHKVSRALDAYNLVQKAGFESVNIDLLFGAPGQELSDWKEDLKKVVDLNPDHISTYCLTFEEDTALYAKLAKGKIAIDSEKEAAFYEWAWEYLPAQGFFQYEISNYSKKGKECRHNLNTWQMNEWIGYGPSAFSQYRGVRRKNSSNIEEWAKPLIQKSEKKYDEYVHLTKEDLVMDSVLFGLRVNMGINLEHISVKFGIATHSFGSIENFFDSLIEEGLMEKDQGRYSLSKNGRIRCDAIAAEVPELGS